MKDNFLTKLNFFIKKNSIIISTKIIVHNTILFIINNNIERNIFFMNFFIKKNVKYIVISIKYYQLIQTYKQKNFFCNTTILYVYNVKYFLSIVINIVYKKPKNLVFITGTNGKTSIVEYFIQICCLLGLKSYSLGTLNRNNYYDSLTSLPSLNLHSKLHELLKNHYNYIALEISSHGITQCRMNNINIDALGITNIVQDHLDYHVSFNHYFCSKIQILKKQILNKNIIIVSKHILQMLKNYYKIKQIKILDYGQQANFIKLILSNNIVILNKYYKHISINTKFHFYNLMCVLGLILSCKISICKVVSVLNKLYYPMGRLNLIRRYYCRVYVDYAHNPIGLCNILLEVQNVIGNKIYIIFGSGGEKDKEKRFFMGQIANELADFVVITDDNPRKEKMKTIRHNIVKKCYKGVEISNRSTAVQFIKKSLKFGDKLVIIGKGHEKYQIIKTNYITYSDNNEI